MQGIKKFVPYKMKINVYSLKLYISYKFITVWCTKLKMLSFLQKFSLNMTFNCQLPQVK